MTGLFDRLRAWLGSFFGDGTLDDDSDATESSEFEGSGPTVAHRDDRPLETPDTLSPSPPGRDADATSDAGDATSARVEIPDAEGGTDDGDTSTPDPDAVSIPDAEAVATGADETPVDASIESPSDAGPDAAADADAGVGHDTRSDATSSGTDVERDADSSDADVDAAFACSVCGTPVDDPEDACPLCHSTDVVPVDGQSGDDSPSRRGRTDVTEADEAAVDRLRDVQGEDG